MDLATASLGRTYVLSDMQQYTFDRTRLLAMMRAAARDYSTAECNQAAMAILERKRQIAQQNAQVARDEKELSDVLNKPKTNAACYRAGVQVLCTTY